MIFFFFEGMGFFCFCLYFQHPAVLGTLYLGISPGRVGGTIFGTKVEPGSAIFKASALLLYYCSSQECYGLLFSKGGNRPNKSGKRWFSCQFLYVL